MSHTVSDQSSRNSKMKYAVMNDFDAPSPMMVCQSVPERGYCYLDRNKSSYDGMIGSEATSLADFGFQWNEQDGKVHFTQIKPSTAQYSDGKLRRWQGADEFTLKIIA